MRDRLHHRVLRRAHANTLALVAVLAVRAMAVKRKLLIAGIVLIIVAFFAGALAVAAPAGSVAQHEGVYVGATLATAGCIVLIMAGV